jgi:hypothetical protein
LRRGKSLRRIPSWYFALLACRNAIASCRIEVQEHEDADDAEASDNRKYEDLFFHAERLAAHSGREHSYYWLIGSTPLVALSPLRRLNPCSVWTPESATEKAAAVLPGTGSEPTNPLKDMVGRRGFEPPTSGLKV